MSEYPISHWILGIIHYMVYYFIMTSTHKLIITLIMLTAVAAPFAAIAGHGGLIPCGASGNSANTTPEEMAPCSLCHLFVLAQNILKFLMWTAAPALAALGFAIGGFKMLISGPNPGLRQDGLNIIKNTVYGLLIVFGAWIIINQLLLAFAGGTTAGTGKVSFLSNPWNQISCPGTAALPAAPPLTATTGPAYDANGTERIGLAAAGIFAKINYCQDFGPPNQMTACTTLAQLPGPAIAGLVNLKSQCNCDLFITGGTERIGHTTHGPGLARIDLQINPQLESYITGLSAPETTPLGPRYAANGATYLLENNPPHWHIAF